MEQLMPPEALRAVSLWAGVNVLLMLSLGLMVTRLRLKTQHGRGYG